MIKASQVADLHRRYCEARETLDELANARFVNIDLIDRNDEVLAYACEIRKPDHIETILRLAKSEAEAAVAETAAAVKAAGIEPDWAPEKQSC